MEKNIAILLGLLLSFTLHASQPGEARLMRFPAIHGNEVVFAYAGDLYRVTASGGVARKITSHVGHEIFPRFSPDGSKIAFTGQYDGNTEVYLIPSEGGIPKRLTYTATLHRDDLADRMGPNNIVMAWTPDGKNITYRSRKQSFNAFKGQLFNVPVDGGLSAGLPLVHGGFCSYSPDGSQLAFNRVFREFRTWKYYQGGMADDIWIYDFATRDVKNITNHPSQDIIPMWAGEEIYFLSDRERTMNLYVYHTGSGETKKVTHFNEYDIKFPSLGGNKIIFENGGFLYTYDIPTRALEKLVIYLSGDFTQSRNEWKDLSKHIRSSDLSPDGERVLFSARGEVFTLPSKSGITRNLTRTPGAHERNGVWSPDGRYIAYLSDESGEFEIHLASQDGKSKPIQLTQGADTYYYMIKWSPDGKKIAWTDRKFRLRYIDIDSRVVSLADQAVNSWVWSFDWSPDSRWITFSKSIDNEFSVVYLHDTGSGKTYPVTDNWYSSYGGSFSRDGKYLYLVSARDFNPVYSETEWNHAYTNMERVYLVTLSKDTPNPLTPENNEVKIEDKSTGKKEKAPSKKEKDEQAPTTTPAVKIDIEGIGQRIVGLPVKASNYSNLYALDDKVYYIESPSGSSASTAKVYDLKKKEETELGTNIQFVISWNGKKMLVKQGEKWAVIDLPTGKIDIKETIDLANLKTWVDYQAEWKQVFDESWRQMRDFFYVENMHGVDWKAMHRKYEPLVHHVRHRDDLTYIIGEMIGELNVGHAYVNSGDRPEVPRVQTGLLGAKISRHPSGYFRIDEILPGANWSATLRSPLLEIGVNAKPGDYIIAVNGIDLQQVKDLHETLVGTAGKQTILTLNTSPSPANSREVIVTPLADESALYYYRWVQGNIRKVSEATGGEVGYIHVPDMGIPGLNEFARHYYPQLNKKALIIDDRGNGGGNVSPMLIERLQREAYRANMFRGRTDGRPVPRETMMGPKVMLIDQYSASDGDLFPYAFKKLGLGKVVGTRTWGGVVGISGPLPFIDGTDLRRPEFASYSSTESKWIIEGEGVEPDIWVDNDPAREHEGEDAQLNKAIQVILEDLKQYKGLPPIPAAPDKSR